MTTKQKVLSIRLAKLIAKNYIYAKNIGLEVKGLAHYEAGDEIMKTRVYDKCYGSMVQAPEGKKV